MTNERKDFVDNFFDMLDKGAEAVEKTLKHAHHPDKQYRDDVEDAEFVDVPDDTLRSDFSLIEKSEHSHPAFSSFREEMKEKDYGRGPLRQAWSFFKAGWIAFEKQSAQR